VVKRLAGTNDEQSWRELDGEEQGQLRLVWVDQAWATAIAEAV
jgi:hypothetical protein